MKRTVYTLAAVIAASSLCKGSLLLARVADSIDESPQTFGCGDSAQRIIERFAPLTVGPLQLDSVYCLRTNSGGTRPPVLSPDGTKYMVYDVIRGLSYGSVGTEDVPQHFEGRVAIPMFGYVETIPFQWSADSRSIFGVRQDTQRNGFALGPLATILYTAGEPARPLPPLKHEAGNLDGLLWVDSNGLALAEFGTKGRYYRPEHVDPTPTIAIVDGRRGKVLQTIRLPVSGSERPANLVGAIDARLDSRGKVYALFEMSDHRWFEWRQGRELRKVSIDTDGNRWVRFSITPDLKSVLVMQNLSAFGVICEHNPSCPPPTPVSGVIADLRDIATGRTRWRINGTASNFSGSLKPAISPEGKYGLINMPPDIGHAETIALISMRDGRLLQSLPGLQTAFSSLNFSPDGKGIRISGSSYVVTYSMVE